MPFKVVLPLRIIINNQYIKFINNQCLLLKAKIYAISSDTHQLYYISLHHFIHTIILLKSVTVRKRQVAILALSSREMPQTVRFD